MFTKPQPPTIPELENFKMEVRVKWKSKHQETIIFSNNGPNQHRPQVGTRRNSGPYQKTKSELDEYQFGG